MRWLKSRKIRMLLSIVTVVVLLVGGAIFALSRGYLMHFALDDAPVSRDEFYRNAYDTSENHIPMYCTSGAALGFIYLWEVRCYSTAAALDAYMASPSGSS